MIVGVAGGLLTAGAVPFSSARMSLGRLSIALALVILHIAACVTYFLYAQTNAVDANIYYWDIYHFSNQPFSFGTVAVIKFTQYLKHSLGGSRIECFLFFQSIGLWGIMLLMRSFQEIQIKMGREDATLPFYLLFLPSVHFWTSAIGKDAPIFFAVSLSVWSALRWRRRLIPFFVALCVMVLIRAHIALIIVMSLAIAATLHGRISLGRRIFLIGVASVGAIILAGSVQQTIQVNVMSAGSLASFIADRNDVAATVGGSTTIGNAPLVSRFIALLFRPFFFDAGGPLGLVASIENIGSVLLFVYLFRNRTNIVLLANRVFFIEYIAIFSAILIVLLSVMTYNIGLGLRERVMVFPPLFCLFVALWIMPGRGSVADPQLAAPGALLKFRRKESPAQLYK